MGGRRGVHPAEFVLVAALGTLYVRFRGLPMISGVFYWVSRAVIALILHSCHRLARLGMEDRLQWGIAAACLAITVGLRAEVAPLFPISGAHARVWNTAQG